MSKYIIRNCKALISNDICELYSQKGIHLMTYCYCKDTNCVLKQVVELCKSQQQEFDEEIKNGNYPDKYKFFKSGRADAGTEILSKFDVEEVSTK